MTSKRNWTQEEIDGLKRKYSRTHFTHFAPLPRKLKRAKRKMIKGVEYAWMFGQWIPQKRGRP